MRTLATALVLVMTPSMAQVSAEGAWSRATAPQQAIGAAYVTLKSVGADKLVSATSPVATQVQLHEMTMEGPVMRMRQSSGIPLVPGQPVKLAPGGLHLMLMGLHAPLKPGDSVPLHLTFEHAPPIDVVAVVQAATATGPAPAAK